MHMPGSMMLRWRLQEVETWMWETGWVDSKRLRTCKNVEHAHGTLRHDAIVPTIIVDACIAKK